MVFWPQTRQKRVVASPMCGSSFEPPFCVPLAPQRHQKAWGGITNPSLPCFMSLRPPWLHQKNVQHPALSPFFLPLSPFTLSSFPPPFQPHYTPLLSLQAPNHWHWKILLLESPHALVVPRLWVWGGEAGPPCSTYGTPGIKARPRQHILRPASSTREGASRRVRAQRARASSSPLTHDPSHPFSTPTHPPPPHTGRVQGTHSHDRMKPPASTEPPAPPPTR